MSKTEENLEVTGTSSSAYKGENGTGAGEGLALVPAVHWRSLAFKFAYAEGELDPI